MIVSTIAYGEAYIRRFFELCLPSLLTPHNLPAIKDEPLELCFWTLENDVPLVNAYLAKPELSQIFGGRLSVFGARPKQYDKAGKLIDVGGVIITNFLIRAIDHCIKKDQSFLFAFPDTIYADGVVQSCWSLHRLTGKITAVFNGRVGPVDPAVPFTTSELAATFQTPFGVQDFFFKHMNAEWRQHVSSSPDQLPGRNQGHLIYQENGLRYVFCSKPNPFIGKFTLADLFFFSSQRGFRGWDHEWPMHLLDKQRLIIQTNLDLGMTIEPEGAHKAASHQEALKQAGLSTDSMFEQLTRMFAGDAIEEHRSHKFGTKFSHFCFTSGRPAA